jgi:hypothetical protein
MKRKKIRYMLRGLRDGLAHHLGRMDRLEDTQ